MQGCSFQLYTKILLFVFLFKSLVGNRLKSIYGNFIVFSLYKKYKLHALVGGEARFAFPPGKAAYLQFSTNS